MRLNLSDELNEQKQSNSAKGASEIAKKKIREKVVKEGVKKTATAATGPFGWLAGIGLDLAEKAGIFKALKALAVMSLVIIISMPLIFATNTIGISFNPWTHLDEILHPGKLDELGESTEEIQSEDLKYAKIVAEYMQEEYNNLEEYIKAECERKGVDYEASKENIVDNTVIPLISGAASGGSGGAQGAVDWALKIAADDSFTYGKKPETSAPGCYFCGTNCGPVKHNKPAGYEKTYVCMTFVTAAYAHGANDPEVLAICKRGSVLHCSEKLFDQVSCFQKIGVMADLTVADLLPGDVFVHVDEGDSLGHMSMYAGNGDIVDASGGGFTPGSISLKKGAAEGYLKDTYTHGPSRNFVMRYTGNGAGMAVTSGGVSSSAQQVIDGACAWAMAIADDNRFHYGIGRNSHHNGCYFCNTQDMKKGSDGIIDPDFTYCCNPFVHAAYAHGGGVPEMLERCKSCDGYGMEAWSNHKDWISVGRLSKGELQKGDVLVGSTHVALYIGDGKVCQAGQEDDNVKGSDKWNNSISYDSFWNGYDRVYRYVGTGGGQMELPEGASINGVSTITSTQFPKQDDYKCIEKITSDTGSISHIGCANSPYKPVAQSFAYTGKEYAVAFTDGPVTGVTGVVKLYSKETNSTGNQATGSLYHANGSCMSAEGTFLAAGKYNDIATEFDVASGISLKGSKTLESSSNAIAYDRDTQRTIIDSGKICVYNNGTLEKEISKQFSHSYRQDMGAAGGYIFACYTESKAAGINVIDIYSESTGDYCGSFEVTGGELESCDIVDGELVLLVHIKGGSSNYIQKTGINIATGGAVMSAINVEALARSRDCMTILSAFSVYDAQLFPIEEKIEFEEDVTLWWVIKQTIRKAFQRDPDIEKTLTALLKKAAKKAENDKNPAFFDILIAGESGVTTSSLTPDSFKSDNVKIGQATCGEGGKLKGGKAGDQSGSEVSTASLGSGWSHIYRAKDNNRKLVIADFVTKACSNNNVGYDQDERSTFYYEAEKVGWDASKVTKKCETSCTELASAAMRAAGFTKDEAPTPLYSDGGGNNSKRDKVFDRVSGLEKISYSDGMKLYPGDILCKAHHTAIVIKSPHELSGTSSFAEGVKQWAYDTVASGKYGYKTYTDDPDTHKCPICHPGSGDGWNCIGFAWASWRHGGKINSRCDCGVTDNGSAERMLDMSEEEASAFISRKAGVEIKVIKNGGNKIPESALQTGDILLEYVGGTSKHDMVYIGDGKYADSPGGNSLNIGTYANEPYTTKLALRYVGEGGGGYTSFEGGTASLIEINPASTASLCELLDMDPKGKYTTEAPKKGTVEKLIDAFKDLFSRKSAKDPEKEAYEIGDTNIETAIETNTDTHMAMLYDNINGQVPTTDEKLVRPIKTLFTKIKLSKKFKDDKKGIECNLDKEVSVYASERGMVRSVIKNDPKLGNYIVIDGDFKIVYAHLNQIIVKQGEMVNQNKIIGTANKKFRMEVYKDGTAIDPEPLFIKRKYKANLGGNSEGSANLGDGQFGWPTPGYTTVTSPFGWRICPFHGREFHNGIDIGDSGINGTTVYASESGTIVEADVIGGYGNCIVIDHGNGYRTLYAHLSSIDKSSGQVQRGDPIGKVGSTGDSTGPHLHFTIYKGNGLPAYNSEEGNLDPEKYTKKVNTLEEMKSSGGNASYESGSKGEYQKYAHSLFSQYGWGDSELEPLIKLWNRESGWNPSAKNASSGAYGIPQSLPGDKMASEGSDWQTNPKTQIRWGLKYIKQRYGSPSEAWAHSESTGWY